MGVTVLLTVAFEIPIFHVAPKLLDRFGSQGLLLIAAAAYVTRVVAYSFIPNGHVLYALILEPLHGVTYGCKQTAVVEFASQRTPKGYEATVQGIVAAVQGVGNVLGLWFGGWATDNIGPRYMYRISAGLVFLGNIVLTRFVRGDNLQNEHFPIPSSEEDLSSSELELTDKASGEEE